MKNYVLILVIGISLLVFSCKTVTKDEPVIGKKELKLDTDRLTPETLWSLGRVGEFRVSPDRKQVLFSITYYDIPLNKGNRDLYIMSVDGSGLKQITRTPENEFNYVWHPEGKKIMYLSAAGGSAQIWEMNPDGSGKKKVSDIEGGIDGFSISPDGKKIAYSKEVFLVEKDLIGHYDGLPLAQGRVINRMMFRHWDAWRNKDQWKEAYSHLFVADFDGRQLSNDHNIMDGETWDFPMRPFWGMEQLSWHPNSKMFAYSCKKKESKAFAVSTNSDIYLYNLDIKQSTNFSHGIMGFDLSPVYSPDGRYLAWTSMERDGYESDKNRLMVFDLVKNSRVDYTQYFDQDVDNLVWSDDSKSIFFVAYWYGSKEIFNLNLNGTFTQLTSGIHDYTAVQPAGDRLIASKMNMMLPTELFSVPAAGGKDTQLTFTNKDILYQLTLGSVEKRWIETTDNKKMLTWIIYPPHFDERKLYSVLLFCQGGPQNAVSQNWHYRWNFQIMAANDYIIVAPNRRGVPGFGQEWKEQISGDYSGQNMKDLLTAIDIVSKDPAVDDEYMGAVGASYGGYSVFWLAGHHNKRFRAFIAHDGMFNLESAYLETDEQWFMNWDLGGPPWDKNNPVAQRSYATSPHHFVANWNTPILISHGEKDYRVVATQGLMAFNAAQLLNVPSQLIYFPDENHWVLKPQNGILWQRTYFTWLDSWLKPPPGVRRKSK
ncbi:MAG: S9 family peptidase [Bacteroidales bacterium]|nr:S9 family peptidase [Bacteroidales bacterium]